MFTRKMQRPVLIFFVLISCIASGQKYHDFKDSSWSIESDFNLGVSSLEGYSLSVGIGVFKGLNCIELSAGFDSQVGKIKSGYFVPARYNDKFYHVELMYGRVFQVKRLVGQINVGLNHYHFKDKYVFYQSTSLVGGGYVSASKSFKGIGLIVSPLIGLAIDNRNILSIEGNFFWNQAITIGNLGLCWKVLF
jgi:hypothetical protein